MERILIYGFINSNNMKYKVGDKVTLCNAGKTSDWDRLGFVNITCYLDLGKEYTISQVSSEYNSVKLEEDSRGWNIPVECFEDAINDDYSVF